MRQSLLQFKNTHNKAQETPTNKTHPIFLKTHSILLTAPEEYLNCLVLPLGALDGCLDLY